MLKTPTRVAVGVVFNAENKILVALRPLDKLQGGLWEFPGGKIEPNETAEEALARELLEEVGITITTAKPLLHCEHHYHEHHVYLEVFEVRSFEGIAYGKEGQKIDWVTPKKLLELPLLSANHPIVEAVLKRSQFAAS
jgi:8-oxo-dGTP diphosphatase